jgi:hypothetical protein
MSSDQLFITILLPFLLSTCGFIVWVLVDGRRWGLTPKGRTEFYPD